MIFLDTSVLGAIFYDEGEVHQKAIVLLDYYKFINESLVINNTVLTEFLNGLSKKNKYAFPPDFINYILEDKKIFYLDEQDYKDAEELFNLYGGSINYSDCTILQTMKNEEIVKIITFDKDFKKANNITVIGQ